MLLPIAEKIIDRQKQALEVKSDGQLAKYWCWPQTGGVSPISTNLYLRRGTVEGLLKNKDFLFLNMILTLNCLNPVHRQGDCPPILFHLACE
jgi:hypothetical protein